MVNYGNPYYNSYKNTLNNYVNEKLKKEDNKMLYRNSLVSQLLDYPFLPEEKRTLVYTRVLDIPSENLEVYYETEQNKPSRLTIYEKEKNEKLGNILVPEGYTYKVFYKEGVLVVRFDKKEPESHLVKVEL